MFICWGQLEIIDEVTCALSGCRHVANMCFVGLLELSNCLIRPKPSPRLLPVIKIEFILSVAVNSLLRIVYCSRGHAFFLS